VKRSFLLRNLRSPGLVAASTALIAATYGLVRLAYGLFLPDVQADLSFGPATAGLISSGASLLYCLGAVVGFFAASRYSRALVVAAGLVASVGAAGMAAAPVTGVFAASSIGASAGAGLASAALVTIVGRNVDRDANDRSQTMVNAGTGPGLVAAGVLALVLLPDWRLAWLVVAGFTALVTAAVIVLDRRSSIQVDVQHDYSAASHGRPRPATPTQSWFASHAHIIAAALLFGAGSAAVWNYGRTLLADAGASEATSIAAWVALGMGGTAVITSARRLGVLEPRTLWTVSAIVVTASSTTLAVFPSLTVTALIACAAFGWGYTAGTGALIGWTTQTDPARAAAGTSVLFVTLVLGQALGATAVGIVVSSAGFSPAFLVAAALTLASAAVGRFWITNSRVTESRISRDARPALPAGEQTRTERAPTQREQTTARGR
jgi:predicted MFS family arabinose efflux permease